MDAKSVMLWWYFRSLFRNDNINPPSLLLYEPSQASSF